MGMTAQDRKSIESQFEGMTKLMNAQFINVHDKMDSMLKKIDYTNGKVGEHEKKINDRELFCSTVQANKQGYYSRKDQDKQDKATLRQKVIQTITLIIMALGLCLTAYTTTRNSRKINAVILNEKIQENITRGSFTPLINDSSETIYIDTSSFNKK